MENQTPETQLNDTDFGAGMRIVAPLLAASMARMEQITASLEKSMVQTSYRDGFADGLKQGRYLEGIRIRETLGIFQDEKEPLTAVEALKLRIRRAKSDSMTSFPYTDLEESDVREY